MSLLRFKQISGSILTTASVSLNTITFTKGDGTTFNITVNTGSGGTGSIPDLQQVTTAGNTTSNPIIVDNGAGESIQIKHNQIIINNALGNATITSPNLTTATEFQIPDKAGPTETFAMLSDLTGSGSGSTSPGGPEQAIQFNSGSTFNGSGNFKYDYVNNNILLTGSLLVTQSYISTVDYIDYTLDPGTLAHSEGRVHWDVDRKTLQIDTDVNNFTISAGHVSVLRGRNTNSYTLTKGTVVYISGNSGQFATFTSASWENDPSSAYTIGLIAQDINANQFGYAVTDGEITGINTNGFAPATLLYLSSSGQYTDTKPVAPKHTVRLGQVVVASTNGILQVKIDNGYELGELHDVLDNTTTSSYGDLLVKSGSLWIDSKQLTGSYGLTGSLNVSGSVINKGSTTLSGSVFISGSTLNPGSGHVLTYNTQSGQLFYTASSAIGGGPSVSTGSLLTTASVSLNTITFTKGDGSTFPITVDTGSGGGGGVTQIIAGQNVTISPTSGTGSVTINSVANNSTKLFNYYNFM